MREIKFKVFNIEKQSISGPYDWTMVMRFFPKDFIPLQYTGLKDKNGKEIYEGDILMRETWGEPNIYYPVEFFEGSFVIVDGSQEYVLIYDNELEVSGNIHDNPELLLI